MAHTIKEKQKMLLEKFEQSSINNAINKPDSLTIDLKSKNKIASLKNENEILTKKVSSLENFISQNSLNNPTQIDNFSI